MKTFNPQYVGRLNTIVTFDFDTPEDRDRGKQLQPHIEAFMLERKFEAVEHIVADMITRARKQAFNRGYWAGVGTLTASTLLWHGLLWWWKGWL